MASLLPARLSESSSLDDSNTSCIAQEVSGRGADVVGVVLVVVVGWTVLLLEVVSARFLHLPYRRHIGSGLGVTSLVRSGGRGVIIFVSGVGVGVGVGAENIDEEILVVVVGVAVVVVVGAWSSLSVSLLLSFHTP